MTAVPRTKNYTSIGTAFDYLMRWHLEHTYQNKIKLPKEWIADSGTRLAKFAYLLQAGIGPSARPDLWSDRQRGITFGAGVPAGVTINALEKCYLDTSHILDNAKSIHRQYLKTGVASTQTVAAALSLVDLDIIFRTGTLEYFLRTDGGTKPDADDITDMLNLYNALVESSTLHSEVRKARKIHLNPNFGKASKLVGGADADIIATGTLIDIKTTKSPEFKRQYWEQLCGYSALANIRRMKIKRVGVYFSRFGLLEIVDLPDVDWPSIGRQLQSVYASLFRMRVSKT